MKQLLLSYKICFILIQLVLAITNKSIAQSSIFNNLYGPGFGGKKAIPVNNDYLVLGQEFDTISKIHLFKLNSIGDTLWNKVIGQAQKSYLPASIIYNETSDKLFLSGILFDTANSTYQSQPDWFLSELNQNGDTLWTKRYGGINSEWAAILKQTPDMGFVLAGYSYSYGNLDGDFYLVKTDSLGNFQWQQTYGGIGFDICYSIALTNDGGYILCGASNSYSPDFDLLVIKTDSIGNAQWQQTYGTPYDEPLGRIISLRDSSFIISSSIVDSIGNSTAQFLKIDSIGNMIWQKNYPSGVSSIFENSAIENFDGTLTNNANGIDAGGQYFSRLIKTTSLGDTLWTKKYICSLPDEIYMTDIQATSDSGYVFCGTTYSVSSMNINKAWVIKVDSLGCDNSSCLITTHLNNQDSKQNNGLKIYPNPFSENTTVEYFISESEQNSKLFLYDSTGRLIKAYPISNKGEGRLTIDGNLLNNGIYFCHLVSENKIISVNKIVIIK